MVRQGYLIAALLALPGAAMAQGDIMAQARAQSANQLGVLEYCQSKGFAGTEAIDAQRQSMAQIPGSGSTGDAEELGKAGTMLSGSTRLSLQELAVSHHIEVSAMCRQMADSAIQISNALKQNGNSAGGIPGLPAMSGMPTVPGMPAMPSMSGMPTMPTMPGVTPAK